MRRCVVSMTGKDNHIHSIEVEAESLFAAAHEGIHEWSRLWWYSGDVLIDVKAGADYWHVTARRVSTWYAKQFHQNG
jgi:hypothetical protein